MLSFILFIQLKSGQRHEREVYPFKVIQYCTFDLASLHSVKRRSISAVWLDVPECWCTHFYSMKQMRKGLYHIFGTPSHYRLTEWILFLATRGVKRNERCWRMRENCRCAFFSKKGLYPACCCNLPPPPSLHSQNWLKIASSSLIVSVCACMCAGVCMFFSVRHSCSEPGLNQS